MAVVEKKRNSYIIKSSQTFKMESALEEQKRLLLTNDVENCYKEEGEQSLQPYLMNEPMYLVTRNIINRG